MKKVLICISVVFALRAEVNTKIEAETDVFDPSVERQIFETSQTKRNYASKISGIIDSLQGNLRASKGKLLARLEQIDQLVDSSLAKNRVFKLAVNVGKI